MGDTVTDRARAARSHRAGRVGYVRQAADALSADAAPLDLLRKMRELHELTAQAIDRTAKELVAVGASYVEIGAALGISRQAARARYPQA